MKRFWLVMLSLGLVLAFSASAMAVDVKFSGSFYAAGMYLDKVTLIDGTASSYSKTSTAFYYQRLRVGTDFIVSPGLKLVTRFDAMERIWGGGRVASSTNVDSAGTRTENENIAFDQAYLSYVSPIGLFQAGYMGQGNWGTIFGDSNDNGGPYAKMSYGVPIGPILIGLGMEKRVDNSRSYVTTTSATDRDYDRYTLGVIYNVNKDIQTGLAFGFRRLAQTKDSGTGTGVVIPSYSQAYLAKSYEVSPYVKAKFGPVKVEAEFAYAWGRADWEDGNGANYADIKIENISAYLNVSADFKMVYGGVTLAYVSGDDPGTTDKVEGGIANGGKDWNPTLIMFNYDRQYWAGNMYGHTYSTTAINNNPAYVTFDGNTNFNNEMLNTWFFQGLVGVRPVAALDINFTVSYANADKKPMGVQNNAYGWEFDVTGTYKITNNLSYTLGAGYLLTGKYFKGTSDANTINNNYLLVNKLTLTF